MSENLLKKSDVKEYMRELGCWVPPEERNKPSLINKLKRTLMSMGVEVTGEKPTKEQVRQAYRHSLNLDNVSELTYGNPHISQSLGENINRRKIQKQLSESPIQKPVLGIKQISR